MKIYAEGNGPLPSHDFKFADGTIETLLWDVDNWTWYWQRPDGTREKLRGVTGTAHRCISKAEILIAWSKKVCFAKLRKILIERHLGPDEALQLWVSELDAAITEAKRDNDNVLSDAASVGHQAHAHIESWIKSVIEENTERQHELLALMPINPNDPEDTRAMNCVIAALTWVARHNVRFEFTERPAFSRRYRYAGTCDGGGLVDSCDNPRCCPEHFVNRRSIIDHKTSNATVPYIEYVYQVCSYQHAIEEQTGEEFLDRWINLYDKVTGEFRAYRFVGREQYERGFLGFRRCLDLTESLDETQTLLDGMGDLRKAYEAEDAAKAKAERLKIDCGNTRGYTGARPSKCTCQRHIRIYEEKQRERANEGAGSVSESDVKPEAERVGD